MKVSYRGVFKCKNNIFLTSAQISTGNSPAAESTGQCEIAKFFDSMIQFGVWHFLYFPVLVRKNRPIVRKYKLELKLELKYLVLEGCSSNFASTFTNIALLKNRKLNNKEKVRQIFVAVLVVLSALVGGMTASAQERNDSSIKKCSNIIRSDCDVVVERRRNLFWHWTSSRDLPWR